MAKQKMRTITFRVPEDEARIIEFTADEWGITMSQVVRHCVKVAMEAWFSISIKPITAPKSEPLDVAAIIMSGMTNTEDKRSLDTPDEDEDTDTSDSQDEDEPINPEDDSMSDTPREYMRPINPNYKTPGQLAKEKEAAEKSKADAKAKAQAEADDALLKGMSFQEAERKLGLTDAEHDTLDQRDMVDLYSPSRPDFQPLTQAEFIAIPMDAKTEALRNLRRFEPELADYYTYQNAETTRKTLTMPEREVDETIDTYNIDAPAIPSDWVISKELLFFPSETVETPNWPITYQNILIKRLHPLTERDRIDSLFDTNRISEFFPQKIVEQIKKYDDGVMPKKLYESRVARQVARRNEDKKQKEDEEFERMLEQD